MTVGEVKNSKFNFQLNIITTLIFGNQFCPYQELLWLHFIEHYYYYCCCCCCCWQKSGFSTNPWDLIIPYVLRESGGVPVKGRATGNYYYYYYFIKMALSCHGQLAFIVITRAPIFGYKFVLQTKKSHYHHYYCYLFVLYVGCNWILPWHCVMLSSL